ncbi:MAG: exodeoxyribonuclease VII large subunit [Bowdeniella nasicola]|nr:exodeoxyribonuclease VII large subunit [Bowdeniella nasicola]
MSEANRPELPATALETTAERPWPLRLLSAKIDQYVARMAPVWVEGQLVQINRRPGATMVFMTLRDTDTDTSMSVAMFARDFEKVTTPLSDGARVVVHAKPTFWAKRGSLQLQAKQIRSVGLGALLARLEELKAMLAAEGLFAPERKVRLPFLPRRIGLVCGRESKAEHDVVVNARARWPHIAFEIREVAVQGVNAVPEVCAAIEELDADPGVDVIIVARGGGSVEDLLPFSNERMVRVAAACVTPLVSAIGHETDAPLLDLVADYRASTPTDAARRVVPDVAEERRQLSLATRRLRQALDLRLDREVERVAALRARPVLARPYVMIDAQAELLASARSRLRRQLSHRLDLAASEITALRSRVHDLSPATVLERGYAVVRDRHGAVLTDADSAEIGDRFEVILARGRLGVQVTASTSHLQTDDDRPATKGMKAHDR